VRYVTFSIPLLSARVRSLFLLPAVLRQTIIYGLDWIAALVLPADSRPRAGARHPTGGEDVFFHWRRLGYAILWRASFARHLVEGEIGLIGWDADVLCFVEVKTRTRRDGKTPQAAVDRRNRREVAQRARQSRRTASTFVPIEIRSCKRILGASQFRRSLKCFVMLPWRGKCKIWLAH